MKVYRDVEVTENGTKSVVQQEIFDIHEATYSGKDMGERKIDATVKHPSPIDFQVGDYMEIEIADLRTTSVDNTEKFYITNLPTVKKIASVGSISDAFEHNITFYPSQYELGFIQMRDLVQQQTNEQIQYTGYDEFSFMGGAHELMRRIIYVLNERYKDDASVGIGKPNGNPTQSELENTYTGWNYFIAEAVDEEENKALEKFQFNFSGNTIMDALMKLNDSEGINTQFTINGRIIYVGFKRPHIYQINNDGTVDSSGVFNFVYGKTSHLKDDPTSTYKAQGGLFDITKTIGTESPITRLYAYGSNKNLNRFYCSDRIKSGRYAAQLMLPSFMNDGKTDYLQSPQEVLDKFGIREGSKRWDDIYPSIRNVTYGTLRDIKYMIRIENSGSNGLTDIPGTSLATIRCYRIVPNDNENPGVNRLEAAWPEKDIAVFVHATGKTVKCVLCGGANAAARQAQADFSVPMSGNRQITGACYCVHKLGLTLDSDNGIGYSDGQTTHVCRSRSEWFTNLDGDTGGASTAELKEIDLHQIRYVDDYWGTDCFFMQFNGATPLYDNQTIFLRDNLSFGCYPATNENYSPASALPVFRNDPNTPIYEVIDVQEVTEIDTDLNIQDGTYQNYFYIYLRDLGFRINDQAYSGQYTWLMPGGEFTVEFLDGSMGGKSFTVQNGDMKIVGLFNENGSVNSEWSDSSADPDLNTQIASNAIKKGAIWRLKCNRNQDNEDQYLPMKGLNPKSGDHIVFTNIYMPDIYILSAQERLKVMAQRYLNDNDNGNVSYAISLDIVRIAQQPNLGRQMREGAIMRIVDDDLKIYTDNEIKELYKDDFGIYATNSIAGSTTSYLRIPYFFGFKANKHYKITFDASAGINAIENTVRLFQSLTGENYQQPSDMTCENLGNLRYSQNINRYEIDFDLPSSFNTAYDYAVGIAFTNDTLVTQNIYAYLISIIESNVTPEEGQSIVKYVDLTIDQLTIKMSDTDRSYSPTPVARTAGSGSSSNNRVKKEIQATVKEKAKTSAWTNLMNSVSDTSILTEQNEKSLEQRAEEARQNFRMLESLRNTIFDPDGTVNETFFRTMMLQIGADSMNYALKNTYIANGMKKNISLQKVSGLWKLKVGADKLYHYTKVENGGNWNIRRGIIPVTTSGNPPYTIDSSLRSNEYTLAWDETYYLAFACPTNGSDGDWIITTKQIMVDNITNCYVFNYGIISKCETSTDNTRFISETRGNVYVYGDNVVLGRIATQDGSSYMDMMRGVFKLGDGLMYANGNLVIGNSVKIGTGNETIEDALASMDKIDNLQIGGENLSYMDLNFSKEYTFTGSDAERHVEINLGKFISENNYDDFQSGNYCFSFHSFSGICTIPQLLRCSARIQLISVVGSTETIIFNSNYQDGLITKIEKTFTLSSQSQLKVKLSIKSITSSHIDAAVFAISNLMVQKGNTKTGPQENTNYLTSAFENAAKAGSTDIVGGMIMTSLLKMRDPSTQYVTAGLSGILSAIINGQTVNENVLLWGGATYQEALNASLYNYFKSGTSGNKIPVLIKKDGTAKIGCFEIDDNNSVYVKDETNNRVITITNNSLDSVYQPQSDNNIRPNANQSGSSSIQTITFNCGTYSLKKGVYSLSGEVGFNLNIYAPQEHEGSSVTAFGASSSNLVDLIIQKNGSAITTHPTISGYNRISAPNGDVRYASEDVTLNLNSTFEIDSNDSPVNISIQLRARIQCTGGATWSYTIDTTKNALLKRLNKYAILSEDGIAIVNNNAKNFSAYNYGDFLDVRMAGLPTNANLTSIQSKQLYTMDKNTLVSKLNALFNSITSWMDLVNECLKNRAGISDGTMTNMKNSIGEALSDIQNAIPSTMIGQKP